MGKWKIVTVAGRGLPTNVDAEGYDTRLAADEMAGEYHDGDYLVAPSVDCRVQAGKPGTEDHDTGHVLDVDGARALVAWQSGVRTWTPIADLEDV